MLPHCHDVICCYSRFYSFSNCCSMFSKIFIFHKWIGSFKGFLSDNITAPFLLIHRSKYGHSISIFRLGSLICCRTPVLLFVAIRCFIHFLIVAACSLKFSSCISESDPSKAWQVITLLLPSYSSTTANMGTLSQFSGLMHWYSATLPLCYLWLFRFYSLSKIVPLQSSEPEREWQHLINNYLVLYPKMLTFCMRRRLVQRTYHI